MGRSSEAVWWSLFAAGGVVAAMLMPITIFLTGIAVPAGWVSDEALVRLLLNPLTRLYLFVMISLSLFHGAHRLVFALPDLGLKVNRGTLGLVLHGLAVVGTLLATWLLIRL